MSADRPVYLCVCVCVCVNIWKNVFELKCDRACVWTYMYVYTKYEFIHIRISIFDMSHMHICISILDKYVSRT